MLYHSTRGGSSGQTFEEVVMRGLSPEGGLYVPDSIPKVTVQQLQEWSQLPFYKLAAAIMKLYIGDEISDEDLLDISRKSYATTFSDGLTTPLKKLDDDRYILELFHGPTFAFKDVALQFLGNLFEYFLKRKAEKGESVKPITVLGATSGDTGSAAIYGLRGKENIDVFILHPKGRVANVQERQMTTVLDSNVHNIAVDGSFDDCQAIVKECFSDKQFNTTYDLAAVNSINWARILAQITYYYSSYFQYLKQNDQMSQILDCSDMQNLPTLTYVVPTGNFGDILAGFYATEMGLPTQLVIATNSNDILHRFVQTAEQEVRAVEPTIAPAMDIQISSNFERYLLHLANNDTAKVAAWMSDFKTKGKMSVSPEEHQKVKDSFMSNNCNELQILTAIKKYHEKYNYIACPHTACGLHAMDEHLNETTDASYKKVLKKGSAAAITLATAHPAKFDVAVHRAIGQDPVFPGPLEACKTMETRCLSSAADKEAIKKLVAKYSSRNPDNQKQSKGWKLISACPVTMATNIGIALGGAFVVYSAFKYFTKK
ncbi:threonine synthase [Sphaeroforma arctica JP610]|uniref:threonine synthase n=1 Tax=Sphaeroforma arctica JP610 TaxID=667725 RepID=A0A0L0G9B7_9EUKA|nr:threonine synthase [Sphaeroforma arctica JP610]KNC85607.1 threonine synthase [Sphaeroforma arctica JP610]|eukprot:XP_014159509.1 threonine synthase [Sphaeroforma arctica JP610]